MNKSEAGYLGGLKTSLIAPELKQKRIDKYLTNPSLCKYCTSIIPYEYRRNQFCNHSCSASYTNTARALVNKKTSECLFCSTAFVVPKGSTGLYCSFNCSAEHKVKIRIDEWLSGGKIASKASVKKYLLEDQNNSCASCGILNVWNGKPIVFDLEHKDGNSDNNLRENLELICPNCHSQTDTYKGKNKGNGRFIRMQRYYSNQSY